MEEEVSETGEEMEEEDSVDDKLAGIVDITEELGNDLLGKLMENIHGDIGTCVGMAWDLNGEEPDWLEGYVRTEGLPELLEGLICTDVGKRGTPGYLVLFPDELDAVFLPVDSAKLLHGRGQAKKAAGRGGHVGKGRRKRGGRGSVDRPPRRR